MSPTASRASGAASFTLRPRSTVEARSSGAMAMAVAPPVKNPRRVMTCPWRIPAPTSTSAMRLEPPFHPRMAKPVRTMAKKATALIAGANTSGANSLPRRRAWPNKRGPTKMAYTTMSTAEMASAGRKFSLGSRERRRSSLT